MMAPDWLVEVEAHTGAGTEILRVSAYGYTTQPGDTPANTHYDERIVDPGYLATSLFGAGRTIGAATVSRGEIVLSNADGALDAWIDYGFDGRLITIRRVASRSAAYSTAETVFSGTVEALDAISDAFRTIRIRIYDRRLGADQPIQTNRYGGTVISSGASADGGEELKDVVKPLCFGRCFKVPAVAVNTFDRIYQVNDGPVGAIAVYDGGILLTADADQPDLANLQAVNIVPGRYATCLALGLFRVADLYKTITADVEEGATKADRTAAQLAIRMLDKMGHSSGSLDLASFDNLDIIADDEVGIFIGAERNGLPAIQDVLSSIGGWIVPNSLGLFSVGRLSAPGTPVAHLDGRVIEDGSFRIVRTSDEGNGIPIYQVTVRYRRQWHTYNNGDIAERIAAAARESLAKEYLDTLASDVGVQVAHLLAPEIVIDTLLTDEADAAAEAARRLGLYKVRRDLIEVDLPFEFATDAILGATVTMDIGRYGYGSGRDMVVVGRKENNRDNTVTLTAWG